MPITSSIAIRGTVGRGGRNDPTDVRVVQTRLNELMNPPRQRLVVDGRCGPGTEAMIADFQRVVLNHHSPDAKVDVVGPTIRALNDPASEGAWARMSMAPSGPLPPAAGGGAGGFQIPAGATPNERQALEALAAAARAQSDPYYLQLLGRMVRSDTWGHVKNAVGLIGGAQYAGEFINAIRSMREVGLSADDIVWVFRQFAAARDGRGLKDLLDLLKARPSLGPSVGRLAKLGRAVNVVSVVFSIAEVVSHIEAGRYGAAAGEIYGTAMGIAVPWAGFLDGVQGLVYAYAPGLRGNGTIAVFFRLLNAINPIGAGRVAVDSAVSLIQSAVVSYQQGSLDIRGIDALVGRMRATPMSIFVQMGESLADWLSPSAGTTQRGVSPPPPGPRR